MTGIESLSGNLVIPEKFLYKGVEYKITSIAEGAFSNNTELISVTMPNTITKIGASAFSDCSKLESVILSNNVTRIEKKTFYFCIKLNHISFSINLKYIGDSAFYGCKKLTNFNFNRALQEIGSNAFNGTSIHNIHIPGNVKKIGNSAFDYINIYSLKLEEGIQEIGNYAFRQYSGYIVEIPKSATILGTNIFCSSYFTKYILYQGIADTSNIAEDISIISEPKICLDSFQRLYSLSIITDSRNTDKLTIPSSFVCDNVKLSISEIGDRAFRGSQFTYISLPDTVKKIGEQAFKGCQYLETVYMTDSVEEIGKQAFIDCHSLKEIRLSNSIKKIPLSCFETCFCLKYVNFPTQLLTIDNYAFKGCSALSFSTFPKNLTYIGDSAFYECHSLIKLYIPHNVKTISDNAFYGCNSLLYVIMEEGVETIGEYAFGYAYDENSCMTTIVVPKSVKSIGYNAFVSIPIVGYYNTLDNFPWGADEHTYKIDEDGNIEIYLNSTSILTALNVSKKEDIKGDITVPYYFNMENIVKYKVKGISANTFVSLKQITSITLEDGIEDLLSNALSSTSVKTIYLPKSINHMDATAFSGCTNLEEIIVDPLNSNFYSENGILMNKSKTMLVKYPCQKEEESYSIPESVVQICSDTFINAKFKSLTITKNVNNLEAKHLIYCYNLTTLIDSNSNYYISNNVLFSKDHLQLIYNANKSISNYEILAPTEEICDYAFAKTKYVDISFPVTIKTIGNYSFSDMKYLSTITLPDTITSIGENVFYSSALKKVKLSKNITTIPYGTFRFCTSLCINEENIDNDDDLIISTNVTTIENYAFAYINSKSCIKIPTNVKKIERYAFKGITKVIWKGTKENIPSGAPWGAYNLEILGQ